MHHSRTRKPLKTTRVENGDRVPPTSAMMLPLGFQGAFITKNNLNQLQVYIYN